MDFHTERHFHALPFVRWSLLTLPSVSRIPDSSDEGVVMDTSSKELSSGNRSCVGIEDDARAGGRYLVVPDGTSTTIDLEDPPPPAICEVNHVAVITVRWRWSVRVC